MPADLDRIALDLLTADRAKHNLPPCALSDMLESGRVEYRGRARAVMAHAAGEVR